MVISRIHVNITSFRALLARNKSGVQDYQAMTGVKIPDITREDKDRLVGFIRNAVDDIGCKGVVIGISGGIDSATVTKLCVDAIGADKVLNVFMPSRVTPA